MPVIKIGKVPFNIYPMAKASTVITSIVNALDDIESSDSGFTLLNYLGADLSETLMGYVKALQLALPKLKKLGITSIGLSTGLVGYYPAIALAGPDVSESSSFPIVRALKSECPEFLRNSVTYETADGHVIIASTLRAGALPRDVLAWSGDSGWDAPVSIDPVMVALLGNAYSGFYSDMTDGLFLYILNSARAVANDDGVDRPVAEFLEKHDDEDGGESTVAFTNTNTLVVKYVGAAQLAATMVNSIPSMEELVSRVGAYFKQHFKNDDLTFTSATAKGSTLQLAFHKDDPYKFSVSHLGLSDPTKTSAIQASAVTRLNATAN